MSSGNHFHCPQCKEILGTMVRRNGGLEFYPKAAALLIETTRTGAVVHCRCGRMLALNVNRMIVDFLPRSGALIA